MKFVPRRGPKSQSEFSYTPLGRWAATQRSDAILTPAGRYVQRRTRLTPRLANLLADLNGLGHDR